MKNILIILFCLFLQISLYGQEIELMTYNIKYANENDGADSWSKRKDFLADQINFYEPDIFGVQEALLEQLNFLKTSLTGYEYVGVGRDDGKEKGEYSAIFYKVSKYKILESDTFWLSDKPKKPSKGWDAMYPRICTWAEFQDKDSKKKFFVFNTHFDHIGEKARVKSAELILDKIEKINKKSYPIFLMGDLNSKPDTKPVELLQNKMKDAKAVSENSSFGPEGTFNAYQFDEPVQTRIDYIFVSKSGISVLKYGVLSDSKDLHYPSDHLPVLIKARFKD